MAKLGFDSRNVFRLSKRISLLRAVSALQTDTSIELTPWEARIPFNSCLKVGVFSIPITKIAAVPHDGRTPLERAFDKALDHGDARGFAIDKSAGNSRPLPLRKRDRREPRRSVGGPNRRLRRRAQSALDPLRRRGSQGLDPDHHQHAFQEGAA
jgi:hypothetical protein